MMLDIFRPDSGEVSVFGGQVDEEAKARIGYLPEDRGLYKDLKLDATLTYLASLKGLASDVIQKRLDAWLERFDLTEHRQKKIQDLSKGMQQKAQIIATLLHEPDLIVVDEPFSGLDPVNTRLVKQIIEEQREAGKTIVMSTHQMYQVEALCNRIVLINRGHSVLYGDVREIKQQFTANALVVEGSGNFANLEGVLDTRRENGVWHMALAPQADPQEVFRQLAMRPDVRLERFELAEPSLDDIFITVVQGETSPGTRTQARQPSESLAGGSDHA